MSGGGQTKDSVQNKDPWAPAQPYLKQIMDHGASLFGSGAGTQTWGGPLIADQSAQTGMGINAITNTANSQMATANQPYNYGQGVIQNNGLTSAYNAPLSTYGGISSGANGITTGGAFGDVAQAAGGPTSSATNLAGMASGADAGQNPYLMKLLQDNANVIGNRVASQMSGAGRYGSAGHEDALARSISAANNPILANAYETDRNRMLSASGQIDSANNAARQTQLGALQGQTGVQGQNISNQLAGAAGQTGIQNFGQANAAQWAGMMPQLQSLSYLPGQQLLGIGGLQDARGQQSIDAQRALFEQQQQMPWTHLNQYMQSIMGTAPLTGNAGTVTGHEETTKELGLDDYMKMFYGGNNSMASGAANAGGALLGMLSDRTEKTDIRKIGTDEATGLGIFAYRYRGDPKNYPKMVGPMAQEVQKKFPDAVTEVGGKLAVSPQLLGILGLAKKAA